jgi:hypothetical protein
MTLQIRMTARYETEIVTLRGDACLVRQLPKLPLIAKIAEIEKQTLTAETIGTSGQRELQSTRRFPQMNPDWK